MKRPYPFSLDIPPAQSLYYNSKFPPVIQPISRSDESASFGNGGAFNLHPVTSFRFTTNYYCFASNLCVLIFTSDEYIFRMKP